MSRPLATASTQPLKLATRLGLAFFSLVLLTLALGGFAISRLMVVHDGATDLATNWLPSIKALGELRTSANQIRRNEADHVLSVDSAEMAAIEKRLEAQREEFHQRTEKFTALISATEERVAYESFKKHKERFLTAHTQLLALSRGGEKTIAETRGFFRGESRTAFNEMVGELGRLVEINEKGSQAAVAAADSAYRGAFLWTIAILVAAMAIAFALALWIIRSVTRQLGAEPAEAANLARRVADGDLSVAIALRAGDTTSLMAALKRMQDSLSDIVHTVRGNAEGVATASGQISQGTTDLSSRTEEQASALEETSASMKELATTVNQNADAAQEGSRLAVDASAVAARGGEVVSQVVDTMKGINDSSRKIADIISVIDGIAFQTNILALNAAVEAARAGEQGRGFAVVAGEVRTLAQRSAEAAKEIKSLITDSVERVGQGSQLVDQAGSTMNEVVASIQRVSELMSRISSASLQQSAGVAQIGEAVNQMDITTQQNAALVEESAAAADSLKQQALQLVQAVAVFKLTGRAGALTGLAGNAPVTRAAPGATTAGVRGGLTARSLRPASSPTTPSLAGSTSAGADEWVSF